MKRETLVVILGALLVGGATCPTVKLPRDPWPTREDGTPLPKECVAEGPVVIGEDEIPRITWVVIEGCDVAPTPTPAPTATPTPAPTPAPTATPTPPPVDPTPTPAPSQCFNGPYVWHYAECPADREARDECRPVEPPPDRHGAVVHQALKRARVRAIDEGIAVEIGPNPHPPNEARARLVDPVDESEVRFAAIAAEEIRRLGLCADSGPTADGQRNAREEVRVAAPGQRTVEVWDVAIGEVIGAQERHMPTLGVPRTEDGSVPPDPDPVDADRADVLCEGFGVHPNAAFDTSWLHHRDANFAFDHWVPCRDEHCTGGPSQPVKARPDGWLWLHPRAPSPWYHTNNDLNNGSARQRHEDGLTFKGGWYVFAPWLAYYGTASGEGCPACTNAAPCATEPPIARVVPE